MRIIKYVIWLQFQLRNGVYVSYEQ